MYILFQKRKNLVCGARAFWMPDKIQLISSAFCGLKKQWGGWRDIQN
jgi:hypothetical protein